MNIEKAPERGAKRGKTAAKENAPAISSQEASGVFCFVRFGEQERLDRYVQCAGKSDQFQIGHKSFAAFDAPSGVFLLFPTF